MAKGLYDQAQKILESYLIRFPDNSLIHEGLGYVYFCQNKLDLAIIEVNKAIQLEPDFWQFQNRKGNIYHVKGDIDKALTYYKKSLAINETVGNKRSIAVNLGNIGEAYIANSDSKSALDCFKRALSIYREIESDWGLAEIFFVLSDCLATTGAPLCHRFGTV